MNTPAHVLVNLALLQQSPLAERWRAKGKLQRAGLWIAAGALLPDAPMFVFFVWQSAILGTPQDTIWGAAYFRESWQLFFDVFNSIPLAALGLLVARRLAQPGLVLLFASVLIHCGIDLALHHDDAHAHFLPFTSWHFTSPVSYWDPRHFGWLGAGIELFAVLAASASLAKASRGRWLRASLFGLCFLYFASYTAIYVLRTVSF